MLGAHTSASRSGFAASLGFLTDFCECAAQHTWLRHQPPKTTVTTLELVCQSINPNLTILPLEKAVWIAFFRSGTHFAVTRCAREPTEPHHPSQKQPAMGIDYVNLSCSHRTRSWRRQARTCWVDSTLGWAPQKTPLLQRRPDRSDAIPTSWVWMQAAAS